MSSPSPHDQPEDSPLNDLSPECWDRLIESVGPASVLVVIQSWMSDALKSQVSAEDIWQETLLHAWRDRDGLEWRGLPAFRGWMLQVARHRLQDLNDALRAGKRGGERYTLSMHDAGRRIDPATSTASVYAGPIDTTTPSRASEDREQAELFRRAIASLPEDLREIVWLRLFEDQRMHEIAEHTKLSVEAVRRRVRKGSSLFRAKLRELGGASSADCATRKSEASS